MVVIMSESEKTCAFDTLFARSVPHILENIFFSLDYKSFKTCMDVNKTWKELLSSEPYQKKLHEMLIEKKNNETKLQSAIKEGNAEEVRILITKNVVDVNNKHLSEAVLWGHNDVVKLLIDAGTDIDNQDWAGRTPLSYAAMSFKDVVKTLLDAGANIDKADYEGATPLHKAVTFGNKGVVQLLIERGAQPNVATIKGLTPLHLALKYYNYHVIKPLMEGGADPHWEDRWGVTPMQEATRMGPKIRELLMPPY